MNFKDILSKLFGQGKLIESKVDQEMARILDLSIEDAKKHFNQIIQNNLDDVQVTENDEKLIPDNLRLDEETKGFFQRFRSVYLFESDTIISLEIQKVDLDEIIIGESKAEGFIYFLKPKDPEVFEVNNGRIMESFPSIYHLILILLPSFEL